MNYTTAAQLYYWPGMKNSIEQMIESCGLCQRDRPSKQRTTIHISTFKSSVTHETCGSRFI